MSLPASLLQHVERHGCFTGCYGSDSGVTTCVDVNQPLVPLVVVTCLDCLNKVGVLRSLLAGRHHHLHPGGQLDPAPARQRGYTLSLSGYHARGPGFWLSAVYYGSCGLFLLSGERSRQLGSDLDLFTFVLPARCGATARRPHDRPAAVCHADPLRQLRRSAEPHKQQAKSAGLAARPDPAAIRLAACDSGGVLTC